MKNNLGKGISLAALIMAAAWLEVNGKPAAGLWFIVVMRIICEEFF